MPEPDRAPLPEVEFVYAELRSIASKYLNGEAAGHTLQLTALVHEAWVKLARGKARSFADRTHLVAVAARAMRQILVDHARSKKMAKRMPRGTRIELDSKLELGDAREVTVLDLDVMLEELEALDERAACVVELRVFGGMTIPEVAGVLDVSESTVSADWRFARAWLRTELGLAGEG